MKEQQNVNAGTCVEAHMVAVALAAIPHLLFSHGCWLVLLQHGSVVNQQDTQSGPFVPKVDTQRRKYYNRATDFRITRELTLIECSLNKRGLGIKDLSLKHITRMFAGADTRVDLPANITEMD